uniref:Putative sodium/sulfate symporter n=1 Tax=Helianthus annuus TaxID=4232 RepID=A0A251S6H9_HELAN
MGLVKRNEWMMLGTMLVTVTFWIFGERLDISTLAVTMMGLSVLLIVRVLSWDDYLSEKAAWNTLTWFAQVGWYIELLILLTMYFLIHYLIVGQTIHIDALYQAFLKMNLTAKVPGTLSTLHLAYNTDLFMHLPITTVVMRRYIMELGIMMAFINMTIWGLVGALWWKIIGRY